MLFERLIRITREFRKLVQPSKRWSLMSYGKLDPMRAAVAVARCFCTLTVRAANVEISF